MLLVVSVGRATGKAYVWDSDDLSLELLPLEDVVRYHNEVQPLNLMCYRGEWFAVKPKFKAEVLRCEDFILVVDESVWLVYQDGWYTEKNITVHPNIIVPVMNYKSSPIRWVVGQQGDDAVITPLLTRTKPIKQRDFVSNLVFGKNQ